MKKNSIFSVMAACMGLFATSCSQEEIVSTAGNNEMVTLSVNIPMNDAVSRTLPTIPEGYTLRCIMDIVDEEGQSIADARQIQEVTADNLTFTFDAPEGGYTCLFWADYVSGDVNTDNLYDTGSLTNITYKETGNALFNNAAADAFFGSAAEGVTSVTMRRPFARINVTPANEVAANYEAYDQVAVTYNTPSGFSVLTGTTSTTTAISYSGSTQDQYWFSAYVFASADNVNMTGNNMSLTLTDTESVAPALNLTIKGDDIIVDGNNHVNVNVTPEEGGGDEPSTETKITITFPGDMQDPNAPREMAVGDYLYKDGTSGITCNNDVIGIIYALATGKTDNSEYGDGKTVKAYAMATTGVERARLLPASTEITFSVTDATPWASGNYNGYSYTGSLRSAIEGIGTTSALLDAFDTWATEHPITAGNLSSWYIPTARQMLDIAGGIFGWAGNENAEAVTTNDALSAAYEVSVENGGMTLNSGYAKGVCNMLSSSVNENGTNIWCLQINDTGNGISQLPNPVAANAYAAIRPVLTVFAE